MALGRWPHLASVPPEAGNSPQDRRCCAVERRAPSSRRLPNATSSVQYQNAARGRRPPLLPRSRSPSARGQPRTPGTSRLSRPRAAAARADGRAVLVGRLGAREGGGRRGYARSRARAPPAEALRPGPDAVPQARPACARALRGACAALNTRLLRLTRAAAFSDASAHLRSLVLLQRRPRPRAPTFYLWATRCRTTTAASGKRWRGWRRRAPLGALRR